MPENDADFKSHSPGQGVLVVTPGVDIDMSRSPELRMILRGALDGGTKKLVVDLAKVEYMDSSGLATLVEVMRLAKTHNASLVLAALHEKVRAIFDIARLDQFFTIVDSIDEAL
ncbi:MAG: anti-sigma B factor antagonist [Phycisphaerales bacterium]|jgi:anti-sigma B factor antagonist